MIKMQNVKKSFENTEVLKDISLNISDHGATQCRLK